jgi:single-strand DNA-binding protein
MNQITMHGNVTADPEVHTNQRSGRSATTFDLAVNSGYMDRATGQWRDRPAVFHRVVCFNDLGYNVAKTLKKGMAVAVTGTLADDSYTPPNADQPIRRTRLEAVDVAVSLRRAAATVFKQISPSPDAQSGAWQGDNGEPNPAAAEPEPSTSAA